MKTSPFRVLAAGMGFTEAAEHCCGTCPHALGGCLHSISWKEPRRLGNLFGLLKRRNIPAGRDVRGDTTPPLVYREGVWVREVRAETET